MGNSRSTSTANKAYGGGPLKALAPAFAPVLAIAALALLLAGPASADGGAPAVWVPLAPTPGPAYGQTNGPATGPGAGPMVLVPYGQSIDLPAPARPPQAWVPDYLSPQSLAQVPITPGLGAPGQADRGALGNRLRNMPRPDDFGLVGLGLADPAVRVKPAAPRGVSFSRVLSDVAWRRETAARLRAQPGFNPKF